jgi:hypothetical protein
MFWQQLINLIVLFYFTGAAGVAFSTIFITERAAMAQDSYHEDIYRSSSSLPVADPFYDYCSHRDSQGDD